MKLLFVADGRSPIALNWIRHFVARGDEVHLVSTFACQPELELASNNFVPVAFSGLKTRGAGELMGRTRQSLLWSSSLVNLRTSVRRFLAPFTIPSAAAQLSEIISDIRPDMIHAMRIPFEGMVAASALKSMPEKRLLISVWGNDFTLHAKATPWMASYTRHTLRRANGLHTDCNRDQQMAVQWKFDPGLPSFVLPGNGGVQLDQFYPPGESDEERNLTAINPRGFRSYIRNDTFFKAIPLITAEFPEARFVCPGMATEGQARKWVDDLGIQANVELLPILSRMEIANLYRRSGISISPSMHDGTPNTLLESMACGCFPLAGDLQSIREWIEPGVNGLLFDPKSVDSTAEVVIEAFKQPGLRQRAAEINNAKIKERAEYNSSMEKALEFYQLIIAS